MSDIIFFSERDDYADAFLRGLRKSFFGKNILNKILKLIYIIKMNDIRVEDDNHLQNNNKIPSTAVIYNNNKAKNKEKLLFFNFLMNNTKIDVHIEEVQSYLFWVGILEYFTWIVLLALFISAPRTMGVIWLYFYHNARATIGLFVLKYIPKTYQVIENLKDYENNSLEDIQKQMENNYITLIHDNERVLRPLLITYFVLTIISIIADLFLFIAVASYFHELKSESKAFALLIATLVYLSKLIN
jgi:hypothetical protein